MHSFESSSFFNFLTKTRYLVFTFSMIVILFVTTYLFIFEQKQNEKKLNTELKQVHEMILHQFESYLHPLQGSLSFYSALDGQISSKLYREHAEARGLYSNFKGSLGFGFIRAVKTKEINSYLKKMKSERPDFHLKRLKDDRVVPRDEILVIEVVEPIERNKSAIGLVVSDELHRLEGAMYSQDTGEAALTKSIQLVQANQIEAGFLLYMPVYKYFTESNGEKGKRFLGWVYSPLIASHVITTALGAVYNKFKYRVFEDEVESKTLLFENKDVNYQSSTFSPLDSISMNFGGRTWKIEVDYFASDKKISSIFLRYSNTIVFFLLGISISFLLFYFIRNKELAEKNKKTHASQITFQKESAFYNSILNNIPESISCWSKDWSLLFCNSNFEEKFLRLNEISSGLVMSKILDLETFAQIEVYIPIVLNGDEAEFEIIRKDETYYIVRLEPDKVKDRVVGFLMILIDITELKRFQVEQKRYEAQLIEKSKLSSLGEVAGGIAHEINNPLAIIKATAQRIKKEISSSIDLDKEKILKNSEKIIETTDRIAKIITGLRNFSRDAGEDQHDFVMMEEVITDTLALCQEKFKNSGIQLDVDICPEASLLVNKVQMSQVLTNLILNSYDAIHENKERWVKVKVTKEYGNLVKIIVQDSGKGIDPQIVKKLMQPFFTTKELGHGTGLGLSISLGIVEKHGGKLYYDSSYSNTTFVIELPFVDAVKFSA